MASFSGGESERGMIPFCLLLFLVLLIVLPQNCGGRVRMPMEIPILPVFLMQNECYLFTLNLMKAFHGNRKNV